MSKVCHTCAWWTEIPIASKDNGTTSLWTCAQAASVIYSRDTVAATRGNQSATESMRNELVRIHVENANSQSHALQLQSRALALEAYEQQQLVLEGH